MPRNWVASGEMPGPKPGSKAPSIEDIDLIVKCKEERERMLAKIKVLQAMGYKKHKAEIAKLIAQRKQLSNASLAEKFETTVYQIGLIEK